MKKLYLTLFILLFQGMANYAQDLLLFDIDNSNYPNIRAKFFLLDENHQPVDNFSPADFRIFEDSEQMNVVTVQCEGFSEPEQVSAVLSIDQSGSMNEGATEERRNMLFAQDAAVEFVRYMPENGTECAVTTFDVNNYLIHDFTSEKGALYDAIRLIEVPIPGKGTDFNAGLMDFQFGSLRVAYRGQFKKIVIFLTDGEAEGQTGDIIKFANGNDITVYAVVVKNIMPESLKEIATSTGGMWFPNIQSSNEAQDVYKSILLLSLNYKPCTIEWTTSGCEQERIAEIEYIPYSLSNEIKYSVGIGQMATLEYEPENYIEFGDIPPGNSGELSIRIYARVTDVFIDEISSDSPLFEVSDWGGSPPPFMIPKDSSREITIKFTPESPAYIFNPLIVTSNACNGNVFFASGGKAGYAPEYPTLIVKHPNGGEIFPVGDIVELEWEGIAKTDIVLLEYTTDNGVSWNLIEEKALGNSHIWRVPDTPSDECLLRARQIFRPERDSIHLPGTWGADWNDKYDVLGVGSGSISIWKVEDRDKVSVTDIASSIFKFSPKGKIIASEYLFYTYPEFTELETYKIPNQPGGVTDVDWSPDELRVIVGGRDGFAYVLEAGTGTMLASLGPHIFPVITGVAWHPVDNSIVATSTDQEVNIWNVETNQLIHRFQYDWAYSGLSWSPNGNYLYAGSVVYSDVTKFDAVNWTRDIVSSPDFRIGNISDVDTKPNGDIVATANFAVFQHESEFPVGLWDAETLAPIDTLYGHTTNVHRVEWDRTGYRLASASEDEVIVWYFEVELQRDESDSLWSIARPAFDCNGYAFGDVTVNKSREAIVNDLFVNNSHFPVTVDSFKISGVNPDEFSFTTPVAPFTVGSGEEINFEIGFIPKDIGQRSAEIVFYTKYGDTRGCPLTGRGVLTRLVIIKDTINFGRIPLQMASTKEETVAWNTGTEDINILPGYSLSPQALAQFSFTDDLPQVLHAGDSLKIKGRFTALKEGLVQSIFNMEHDEIGSPLQISFIGEGYKENATALFAIDTLELETNKVARFKIRLMDSAFYWLSGVGGYKAVISFNKTLMVPILDTPEGKIVDDKRVIELNLPALPVEENIMSELMFRTTLGNADETVVSLDSIIPQSGEIETGRNSGLLRITNICYETGEPRFVEGTPKQQINSAELSDDGILGVNFTAIEKGVYKLSVFDISGRQTGELSLNINRVGEYKARLEVDAIAANSYIINLHTPSTLLTYKLAVVK